MEVSGIIVGPIGLQEMYVKLGIEPQGSAFELAELCSNGHGKINKWAKYKPEATGGPSPLTEQQRKENNYGLRPAQIYTSVSEAVAVAQSGTIPSWGYAPPAANRNWMRLSDFNGYAHNATSPFGYLRSGEISSMPSGSYDLRLPILQPYPGEGWITAADFQMADADYQNWYPGAILFNSSRTLVATGTEKFADSDSGWTVDFGVVPSSYGGQWSAVIIMSSAIITPTSWPNDVKIVFVGDIVTLSLVPYVSAYRLGISGVINKSATPVTAEISVTCYNTSETSSFTFNNVKVFVAKDTNGTGSTNVLSLGNITVPANDSETIARTINLTSLFGTKAVEYDCIKVNSSTDGVTGDKWTMMSEGIGGGDITA